MRHIDIPNPKRVDRNPDKIIELLSNGSITENGYVIKNIQLRLYIETVSYTHLTLPTKA